LPIELTLAIRRRTAEHALSTTARYSHPMRPLVVLALLLAGCLDEHGRHPDGLGPPLDGTWTSGPERITFRQVDLTLTWSIDDRVENGTWRITIPNRLELICPSCPFADGVLPVRIGKEHLLMDGVMEGGDKAVPNASWTGLTTDRDLGCSSQQRTFARTVTLAPAEATDRTLTCCTQDQMCVDTITARGSWSSTADGFSIEVDGTTSTFFLIDSAISHRRWTRDVLTPSR
jgi:hypothetical protein